MTRSQQMSDADMAKLQLSDDIRAASSITQSGPNPIDFSASQIFKFGVLESSPTNLDIFWEGHAEGTNGDRAELYAWNAALSRWDPIGNILGTADGWLGTRYNAVNNYLVSESGSRYAYALVEGPYLDGTGTTSVFSDVAFIDVEATVSRYPTDVALDVGGDGTKDWTRSGALSTTVNVDFKTALSSYAAKCGTGGMLSARLALLSTTTGILVVDEMEVKVDLPPRLDQTLPDVEMDEDKVNERLLDLYGYFEDPDDPDTALDFSILSATNASIVAIKIAQNRYLSADALTGEANDNWTGVVRTAVRCTDRVGLAVNSSAFNILVENVNDPPLITSEPGLDARAGVEYVYEPTAVDGDGDSLTFGLAAGPPGMSIDSTRGRINWTPSFAGRFDATLTVSDGEATASQDFTLAVPNRPPRITSSPPTSAFTGERFIYNVIAVDEDQDPLAFSLGTEVDDLTIDAATGILEWVPAKVGEYNISVAVSDGKARVFQNFSLSVAQGNRPPKFESKPVTNATAWARYSYNARAVDEDGDALTYSLVSGIEGMSIGASSGRLTWTPAENQTGKSMVRLRVSDGRGGEDWQEYAVFVAPPVIVRPAVEITYPLDGERIRGEVSITGTAVKGSRDIAKVQVRVDSGQWRDAGGTGPWSVPLDTRNLRNGLHVLEARAYDGTDFSDAVRVDFRVDNSVPEGLTLEGPMAFLTVLLLVLAVIGITYYLYRKGKGREPPAQPAQRSPSQPAQEPPEAIPLDPIPPASPPSYRQ